MKEKVFYNCSECGYESVRWLGKCPNCGAWNSFAEEFKTKKRPGSSSVQAEPRTIEEIAIDDFPRTLTGIGEFDRVLGGGIVKGSLILLAGEPGVGKSTLLVTAAGALAGHGKKVLYVTGEESLSQVKLRARRLGVSAPSLYLLAASEVTAIKQGLEQIHPDVVIVDSIQTVFDPDIPTTPGSVAQVRENANFFMQFAKKSGTAVFLVGHITKEGAIAGPKIMEHIVDVVLYFEGETRSLLRIMRAIKNRFGATSEIGVFSMEESGLKELPEAGAIFLSEGQPRLPGAVIFPAQEGTRTMLVELQALVTPTYYGMPKRSVTGFDYNRGSLIVAVLEKKLHYNFGTYDVYINVGGGLKLDEPGCDLAVALACVSSFKDVPPLEHSVYMGEVALTGEIRPIGQVAQRLKEAARLGFKNAVIPFANLKEVPGDQPMTVSPVRWLKEAVDLSLKL